MIPGLHLGKYQRRLKHLVLPGSKDVPETDRDTSIRGTQGPLMGLSLTKLCTMWASKEIVMIMDYNTVNLKKKGQWVRSDDT